MNKLQFILTAVLVLCAAMPVHALGNKEKNSVIQVTGVVRLVGNASFSELVVTGVNTEWYIAKADADKFHNLQHQTVTVEGEEKVIEMRFASGLPAGTRRELKNIKIIRIH
jgi:tRNA A37 methylthiotransferase MiaB